VFTFDKNILRKNVLRPVRTVAALGLVAPLLAACGGSNSSTALPSVGMSSLVRGAAPAERVQPDGFNFTTLDDQADPTFNQLLGINNSGEIAGYFGSGAAGHPNKGYTLAPPYGQSNYTNENFPGSAQTQVTALNNLGYTAGFWVDSNGNNFGFVEWNGVFTSYKDPKTGMGTVNQILGLNDAGVAVGFYTDGSGMNHGFSIQQGTKKFVAITPPGGTNVTAAGINQAGDITGFLTAGSGMVIGFLEKDKTFTEFAVPGATSTTPLGINKNDEIVGTYLDGSGLMHGFTATKVLTKAKFTTRDDPNGIGTTTINGINDKGNLVGFYVDTAGNTDGFLAKK
jgi:hypothetical protein